MVIGLLWNAVLCLWIYSIINIEWYIYDSNIFAQGDTYLRRLNPWIIMFQQNIF